MTRNEGVARNDAVKNYPAAFVIGILLVFALAWFSGCGVDRDEDKDFLRLRLPDDPSTLDPAFIVDVPGGAIAAKLFNGLVRFDPEGRIVPDIASDWEISEDGRTYRFRLREGVRFTNGREVEAEDFVYSFRRLLDPKLGSPRSWLLESIKGAREFSRGEAAGLEGIRAAGKRMVEIELVEPLNLFLFFLAMPNASVVPREEVESREESFADHPCGTGPFKLKEWKHANSLLLVKNPDYFERPPILPGIVYRVIPEDFTAAVEFERGGLDVLEIPRAEFKKYTTEEPWKNHVLSRVGLNIYYLGFNCRKPPFDNPLLRQALNHAIDRGKIIASLLEGRAETASGPVPPGVLSPFPESPGYGYDPEKARRLLAESGVAIPLQVRLLFKSDREALSIAEVIQDYLKKVGIHLVLVQREWSSFKEAVNKGDFDLFYLSWWADYPSAENFLYPTFYSRNFGPAGNRCRFGDDEVDRLLRKARGTRTAEEADDLYREIQMRIVKEAPWVFLWHKKDYVVCHPRVKNYRIPLIHSGDKFEGIELISR